MSKKNVLVIGGASGIGKEIALNYAREGNKVAVADINQHALNRMITESQLSTNLFSFEVDAGTWGSVESLVQEVQNSLGEIHAFVYSAGITKQKNFLDIDWQTWKKTMAVNLHGLFYSIKAVLPIMESGGSIVIIGSGSAITGSGGGIHYASSKGGAFGLMRSLVTDLGREGININVVAPRVIESDMLDVLYPTFEAKEQLKNQIPINRLGMPEDVSNAVIFLSSDQAKYIHGQILLLDGGRTYKSSY